MLRTTRCAQAALWILVLAARVAADPIRVDVDAT